ncbi:MAG: hypothetical protein ACXAEU_09690 [Candidatus Hodarchaeales archaeon]|jgi:phenylalanyl-tRNA synthetase alpha subunit
MSEEGSDNKTGDLIAKQVAKNVNKILEVYLKQVFGPMVRDIRQIDEKITSLDAEIKKINQVFSKMGKTSVPDASQIEELIQKAVESKVTTSKKVPVEDTVGDELAAASSKKEYIYDEMVKVADYFEAKDLPESQLYEKRELKEKVKEITSFLNKEVSAAGTQEPLITVIQDILKLMKDLDYKLNSSLQARFYKEDFIDFIGNHASREIAKIIKDIK